MFLKHSVSETVIPLYPPPLLPAGYQVQLWILQAGQFGVSLPEQELSPVGRAGLEIPQGEDLAPAGPAMSPALR